MTIVPIRRDLLEHGKLQVRPRRQYRASDFDAVSGTYGSVTGSVYVYAQRSDSLKEVGELSPFNKTDFTEGGTYDLNGYYDQAKKAASDNDSNYNEVLGLLRKVNAIPSSSRQERSLDIIRIDPGVELDSNFMIKRTLRERIMHDSRVMYPSCHWAYTNYSTLNFFTASTVPSDTVLMYPNTNAGAGIAGHDYIGESGMSFDFRINPRYITSSSNEFKAGTVFHVSGVYAVSLLTGSSRDVLGRVDKFRLALQVHSGTYTLPSMITDNASGIFLSDDNVLNHNHWHHVVIRWGGDTRDSGTGSFVVDGVNAGDFVIPSASLRSGIGVSPDILYVGNFYEGTHTGSNTQDRFFSNTVATQEGLVELQSDPSNGPVGAPDTFRFEHPLNAEVHELRIWDRYIANEDIESGSVGLTTIDLRDLLFYVPPYFTPEAPYRQVVSQQGGVLQTPFTSIDGTTDTPFNVALSFGLGVLYHNLENYTRDFARGNYPRLYNLSASVINTTAEEKPATQYFYSTGSVRKRALTVLPCDDGLFTPDYSLLNTGTVVAVPQTGTINFRYANDLGVYDPSLVRLTELLPSESYYRSVLNTSGTLYDTIVGATSDTPGLAPGSVLNVYQRTRDNSSNEVVIFDVSNLFYGDMISPNSFEIYDSALSGSDGVIQLRLKDNGYGNLYRADAETKHAVWASVGNVVYEEGMSVVLSPNAPFFGREQHYLGFEGNRNIHTFTVRVPAEAGLHTSSSNPTYQPISASLDANEIDPLFVYLTGINFHDENMNVVMKSTLAQPVIKRTGESLTVKIGVDY